MTSAVPGSGVITSGPAIIWSTSKRRLGGPEHLVAVHGRTAHTTFDLSNELVINLSLCTRTLRPNLKRPGGRKPNRAQTHPANGGRGQRQIDAPHRRPFQLLHGPACQSVYGRSLLVSRLVLYAITRASRFAGARASVSRPLGLVCAPTSLPQARDWSARLFRGRSPSALTSRALKPRPITLLLKYSFSSPVTAECSVTWSG